MKTTKLDWNWEKPEQLEEKKPSKYQLVEEAPQFKSVHIPPEVIEMMQKELEEVHKKLRELSDMTMFTPFSEGLAKDLWGK